jgi:hypothetical protein
MTRQRLIAWALSASLILLAIGTGIRKIRAPDYWWHLSAGNWIAEHGAVPKVDVFTYTAKGASWLDIHWLFQLGLSGLQGLFDHEGVVVAKALLSVLLVAIVASVGLRRDRPFVAAFGLGLMLLAANDRILARPELTSFILLASIIGLLERDTRRADAWLYAIIPLQLLWVNSHGLFALGLALCAIYTMGEGIRSAMGRGRPGQLRRLVVLTGLAGATSLANPNHLAGALYPLEQLGMITPDGAVKVGAFSVGELIPIWHPRLFLDPYLPALALALFAAIALAQNWRWAEHREEHALVLVMFFALFAMATRNAAIFAIAATPILILNANEWFDRHPPEERFEFACSVIILMLLVLASVDIARGSYYSRIRTYHEPGIGYLDLFVAEGAADWIEREKPPGRIAHSMIFGGYLGWRLYPNYEVMVDGRLEVFGPELLAELALNRPGVFSRLEQKYDPGIVVLSSAYDSPKLIAWLFLRPDWRLVQLDTASMVFIQTDPGGDSPWAEVDIMAPGYLSEMPRESDISEGAYLSAQIQLQKARELIRRSTVNPRPPAPGGGPG